MDLKAMARLRFAYITDAEERLILILTAELGDELVAMLPYLIEVGACSFRVYNAPCPTFNADGIGADHKCLYVWLEIHLGTRHISINFAGLMRQYGDTERAADFVEKIIRRQFGTYCDYSSALQVRLDAGDVLALRTHFPSSPLRDRVELSFVYHALKEPGDVGVLLGLIPGDHSTYRVSADQQLQPVVQHLKSVGVEQIIIDEMVELLFRDETTLSSLDKVVALAAIHKTGCGMDRKQLLRSRLAHILDLHFADRRPFVRSSNMVWLVRDGLCTNLIIAVRGAKRDEFDDALVRQLAQGRLGAVFQFLLTCVMGLGKGENLHRPSEEAKGYVESLLPRAFQLAMNNKRYGTAAAIAQVCEAVSNDDRTRAIELALVYGERIRIESLFYRLQ